MGRRLIDLGGQRFGRLLVLRLEDIIGPSHISTWRCRCDCGRELVVRGHNLRRGDSRSCGCARRTRSS